MRLLLPSVPLAIFNGVLVESEPCSGVGDSIGEVEERGLPCGVQLREGQHPEVEAESRAIGLTERTPMPGMTLASDELVEVSSGGLAISRVDDEAGLVDAAKVAASAFGAPPAVLQALYSPEVAGMDGMSVYLGRIDAEAVTTAMGYRTGREGAIFSVATPAEHRRHGYGAAITAFATRSLFESGADLVWLQTSPMGSGSTSDSDSVRSPTTFCLAGRMPIPLDICSTSRGSTRTDTRSLRCRARPRLLTIVSTWPCRG